MLCSECGKKSTCKALCSNVNDVLYQNRNYKTTYKNHEVSLGQYAIDKHVVFGPQDSPVEEVLSSNDISNSSLPLIHELVESTFTPKQKTLFQLHFSENMPVSTVAQQLQVSQQTVHQAIYGHPKNGGGIVRKLQKSIQTSHLYQPSA
jgi:predicted DNA-binding protein YlxM (UPF0122 family)